MATDNSSQTRLKLSDKVKLRRRTPRYPCGMGEPGSRGSSFENQAYTNPKHWRASKGFMTWAANQAGVAVMIWFLALPARLLGEVPDRAGAEDAPAESHRERAQRLYEAYGSKHRQNPSDARAAWEFARACYDLADFAETKERRESLALEGIEACRLALQTHPRVAPAHYYLALNYGQQARTKTLGALRLVSLMEESFLRSIELDPKFDFAGAHRALGILYRDAPGWPASIGNKTKSRKHLGKALEMFPEYPGNHLTMILSLIEWQEKAEARKLMETAAEVMRQAREKLTGPRWALSWEEWEGKWQRIQTELGGE